MSDQPDMFPVEHRPQASSDADLIERIEQAFAIPHALLQSRAEQARNEGMQRAVDHAEIESPDWAQHAYEWLELFVAAHAEPFISEDVSDATKLDEGFPQPPTDRAWGSIYRSAVKRGLIRLAGTGRSRRRHASICPLWIRA
jgi:hypothetical protein